jgi:hypothetical protein
MFNVLGEAVQIVFARHVSVWERGLVAMSKAGVLAEPEAALPHFRLQAVFEAEGGFEHRLRRDRRFCFSCTATFLLSRYPLASKT